MDTLSVSHLRLCFGITAEKKIQKPFFFKITLYFSKSDSTVCFCGFASSCHTELGSLTECRCGIFKELANIKGEVAVAGGVLEEEDLPAAPFRPERGLGQVVSPFNVSELFMSACGS